MVCRRITSIWVTVFGGRFGNDFGGHPSAGQNANGEPGVIDELMPLVYDELRRIAQAFMRRQPSGHTLQPTALVNEAFIKVFGDAQPTVGDRAHLLALMSRVMRQVLVDHARASAAAKRGGGRVDVEWNTNIEVPTAGTRNQMSLLDLHAALEALNGRIVRWRKWSRCSTSVG